MITPYSLGQPAEAGTGLRYARAYVMSAICNFDINLLDDLQLDNYIYFHCK